MDLRGRINEELDNLKFERLVIMTHAMIKSLHKDTDFNIETLKDVVYKSAERLGIRPWAENMLVEKVVACFELSGTFDINSPDFNRNPELKTFDVDVVVSWSGYGRDYHKGRLQGYSQRSIEDSITTDGLWSELELDERDFRHYETDEIDITNFEEVKSPINESEEEKEKLDYDRVKHYLEYYSNLTPSDFDICKKGNEIIITIPEERKS